MLFQRQKLIVTCIHEVTVVDLLQDVNLCNHNCRAGSEATNRAAMSFLYVCMYGVTIGSARAYGEKL